MKLLNDSDIPEGYTYIYKRDVFRKGNLYYKFVTECATCGNSYLMRISNPTKFCSKRCANKNEGVRSSISKSLLSRGKSIESNKSKNKRIVSDVPKYSTYAKQIDIAEDVRDNNGILEVRCSLCMEWFVPKRTAVENRAQFIKGNTDRESRLYCSDACKSACPIFNKHKYPSGTNPRKNRNHVYYTEYDLRIWAKFVLERDNHTCVYCGSVATVAHHIIPKKVNPFYALDVENGISCCSTCHYEKAHIGTCSAYKLSKLLCN